MKSRPTLSLWALVALAAFSPRVSAQKTAPPAAKAASSASVPDISGVWSGVLSNNLLPKGAEPPLTAWGMAQMKTNKPAHGDGSTTASTDPVDKCFPPGIPRLYYHPFPMEILQIPGRVVMVFEYDHFVRNIYTDGRPHPADLSPTWMGDAIGHWEGDTLVVDTIGFNEKTWLDRAGLPHSDALHLTERIRRADQATLVDDMTIEDPKAYTKPWTAKRTFALKPKWNIMEFVCLDQQLNFDDYQKKTLGSSK
jgi:hypothetical protein